MTFLPSYLLAIISTLDLTNKKSLSILISHPSLVLLPTFTYFSYAKLQICEDRRITFSPKMSIVNIILNTVHNNWCSYLVILTNYSPLPPTSQIQGGKNLGGADPGCQHRAQARPH